MNACFTFLESQTGVGQSLHRSGGGADTHTTEFAAAAPHPFLFHGLDLCTSYRLRENRPQQFLYEFLPYLPRLSREVAKCQVLDVKNGSAASPARGNG